MVAPIRTLLICWLLLALPVQGIAAATMAFCGAAHHAGAVRAESLQGAAAGHSHHAGDAPSAHHHHGATHQAETAAPADAASAPVTLSQGDDQKCSACASCCSFSAVPSTALAVPVPAPSPTLFSAVVLHVDPFAADGPDRPPRIVLA